MAHKLILKIANSRGKKPVINDIDKARKIISNLMVEINPCDGKDSLKRVDDILYRIVQSNKD